MFNIKIYFFKKQIIVFKMHFNLFLILQLKKIRDIISLHDEKN